MMVGTAQIKLQAPWVHSLKEKRMVVKSLMHKAKNKFNISIAEVDAQDVHQTIVIGIACVSTSRSHTEEMLNSAINFMETNTEAIVVDVFIEID